MINDFFEWFSGLYWLLKCGLVMVIFMGAYWICDRWREKHYHRPRAEKLGLTWEEYKLFREREIQERVEKDNAEWMRRNGYDD
jgi:hypothetical protein